MIPSLAALLILAVVSTAAPDLDGKPIKENNTQAVGCDIADFVR